MRVWELAAPTGPDGLVPADRPDPPLGPGDVRVAVRAVSLQYRDLLMIQGRYGRVSPGLVPCSDASGDVIEVGAAVREVAVGDRVTSTFAPAWQGGRVTVAAARSALGAGGVGALADTLVLPAHGVVPAPDHLSHEEAATLPCAALTAWHALWEEGTLAPGGTLLTIGSGGVSVFALQFAVLGGARVIVTTRTPAKADRLAALGASAVVDTSAEPAWGDRVKAWAGGEGVDQVIEVGGHGTFDQSVRALRIGGTISLIGVLAGPAAVNLTPVLMRNIRVQGVLVGSREMFARMNAAIAHHRLRPVVDRVWPFVEAPAAFRALQSGAHVGKLVVSVP